MTPLASKLKQCRIDLQLTQAEAAQASGLEQRDVSRLETGKTKTPPLVYMQFLHKGGVDLNYLLDDAQHASPHASLRASPNPPNKTNGTKKIKESEVEVAPTPQAAIHQPTRPDIIVATQDISGNLTVPIVNRSAAGSYLTGYQTQEYFEHLDAMTVPSYLLRGGQGIIIQAVNDSMEDTIFEGDLLLCRLVEPSRWDDIADFTVCVVVSESRGIQVKRIKPRLEKEGLMRCKSDNRRYPSFNLFAEDILQVWQVAMLLTAQLPNRADTIYRKVDTIEDSNTDLREMYEHLRQVVDGLDISVDWIIQNKPIDQIPQRMGRVVRRHDAGKSQPDFQDKAAKKPD